MGASRSSAANYESGMPSEQTNVMLFEEPLLLSANSR